MTRSRAGFTLIELLLSVALIAMAIGIGIISMGKSRGQATTRSLGEVVLEEFRLARETAQASNSPVAVVIPSGGGSTANSQSLYILEGETNPQVTHTLSYSGDYPNAVIYAGGWAVDPSLLGNAALTPTANPPQTGTLGSLDVTAWDPNPLDYAFIFLPTGTVVTNGLVNFDGNYHLAIGQGAVAAPSGPPGGTAGTCNYFNLLSIGEPQTLVISPLGHLELQPNLVGAVNGLAGPASALGALAPQKLMVSTANHNPQVLATDWSVLPAQNPATQVSANSMAAVSASEFLTFTVKATDVDGDPLFCQWAGSCTSATNPSGGNFSVGAALQRMTWNPADNKYEATVEWRPPANAKLTDIFAIDCVVADNRGGTVNVTGTVVTKNNIEYHNPGHIFATDGQNLYSMLGDGTKVRQYAYFDVAGYGIAPIDFCSATSDGTRLVCSTNNTNTAWGGDIGAMSADGTGEALTLNYIGWMMEPDMSVSGKVAAQQHYYQPLASSTYGIYSFQSNGNTEYPALTTVTLPLTAGALEDRNVHWSPDGTQMLFIRDYGGGNFDCYKIVAGSPPGTETLVAHGAWDACWSADGTQIACRTGAGLVKMNNDGTSPVVLLSPAVASSSSTNLRTTAWSPDGTSIAFSGAGGQAFSCSAIDGSNVKSLGTLSGLFSISWVR